MFNHSKNPRVWKSLDKTASALFTLLPKKKFSDITVSEVCVRAGITRKTFYRDFDSLEDVIDFAVYARMDSFILNDKPDSFSDYLLQFFSFCQNRKEYLTVFVQQGIYYLLANSFSKYLQESAYLKQMALDAGFVSENRDYFWKPFVGLETSFVGIWVERGFKESSEEAVKLNVALLHAFKGVQ
jgi:hypothetical protein